MISSKQFFLNTYQKVPVIEFDNNVSNKPLVSICVQTYNQEKFVAKCLDGILMQKTNFEFEILLGEDDSPDKTREICLKYAKKYKDKIRLFLHSRENNIKVYNQPTGQFNFKYNIFNARGKYIAICEGDDYWTDELKLQKQIDFLEKNTDYGLIFSDVDIVDEFGLYGDSRLMQGYKTRYKRARNFYKEGNVFWELLDKNFINTLTVCAKKKIILDYFNNFPNEEFLYDHRIWLHIATYSKIKYNSERWGDYRVLSQGISNSDGFFFKRKPLIKQSALLKYLTSVNYDRRKINKEVLSRNIFFILNSKSLSTQDKKPTIKMLLKHPLYFVNMLIYKIKRKMN